MTTAQVDIDGDQIVLWLSGELDVAVSDDIGALGHLIATQHGARTVVVDMSQVTFVDSTAIGALIAIRNDAVEHGLTLTVRSVAPRVRKIFAITGLIHVLGLPPSE